MATAERAEGIIGVERLRILFNAFLRDEEYDKAKRITAYLPGCEAEKDLEMIHRLIRREIAFSLGNFWSSILLNEEDRKAKLKRAPKIARLLPTQRKREETLQAIIEYCIARNSSELSSVIKEAVDGLESPCLKKQYQEILAIYE